MHLSGVFGAGLVVFIILVNALTAGNPFLGQRYLELVCGGGLGL